MSRRMSAQEITQNLAECDVIRALSTVALANNVRENKEKHEN